MTDKKITIDSYFEEEYQKVKPIFEIILPYVKQNGWQYGGVYIHAGETFSIPATYFTAEKIQKQIEDHHFEDNSKLYEKGCPGLENIPAWYLILRDFVQRNRFDHLTYSKKTAQRLHEDFDYILDEDTI